MTGKALFTSQRGGTISIFQTMTGILFQVNLEDIYIYCKDLVSAKIQLKKLEDLKRSSNQRTLRAIKKEREALRTLVEKSAAPYLHHECSLRFIG